MYCLGARKFFLFHNNPDIVARWRSETLMAVFLRPSNLWHNHSRLQNAWHRIGSSVCAQDVFHLCCVGDDRRIVTN